MPPCTPPSTPSRPSRRPTRRPPLSYSATAAMAPPPPKPKPWPKRRSQALLRAGLVGAGPSSTTATSDVADLARLSAHPHAHELKVYTPFKKSATLGLGSAPSTAEGLDRGPHLRVRLHGRSRPRACAGWSSASSRSATPTTTPSTAQPARASLAPAKGNTPTPLPKAMHQTTQAESTRIEKR